MLTGMALSSNVAAIPILQLYIEGATYDPEKGWYYPGHSFRLWTIANISGPGRDDGSPITNVRLSAVYDDPGVPVTISITPALIGGSGNYNGFTDSSLPAAPTWLRTVTDGSTPLIGGSKYLPPHDEYGAGNFWQEFNLGNFTLSDSQIADFIAAFPLPGVFGAQINAYDVVVTGADVHFDLYGQVTDRGRISNVFATPGHDATDGPVTTLDAIAAIGTPNTLALFAIGTLGFWFTRRRRPRTRITC